MTLSRIMYKLQIGRPEIKKKIKFFLRKKTSPYNGGRMHREEFFLNAGYNTYHILNS